MGFTAVLFAGFFAIPVLAEDKPDPFGGVQVVTQVGYGKKVADAAESERQLNLTLGFIIKTILSFVGFILLAVVIYAGFLWLTAGGNTDQVDQARKWIANGIIGMILITAAYFITDFIVASLNPVDIPTSLFD
ncbi:MAG: Uncharacterized protein G01um101418_320 [Parcubacteria group bacterium Gr01-1014_18]|nr:MAG: Uncharacterized protein Greene041636_304 [Parcubacteria group bacterium Greene0416_36]TSC81180.1 MAG: Uncharacterized protein G01um101418_320 [Parcubacteria group bacterium Gr01-1014_18]TSC99177.1 MAG: Uncharacterized protein Greene101420_322 [Parcubacteria group bacterium Greene1014_20]TSD07465.1 MAG: Uncharacterized protein Greene07142_164 [Parcubacteria group bacterium Greene0714_2]